MESWLASRLSTEHAQCEFPNLLRSLDEGRRLDPRQRGLAYHGMSHYTGAGGPRECVDACNGARGDEFTEQVPGQTWGEASKVTCACVNTGSLSAVQQLLRLHLHNASLKDEGGSHVGEGGGRKRAGYVDMFGFDCTTCCGFIPMPNDWCRDWVVSVTACGPPAIDMQSHTHWPLSACRSFTQDRDYRLSLT